MVTLTTPQNFPILGRPYTRGYRRRGEDGILEAFTGRVNRPTSHPALHFSLAPARPSVISREEFLWHDHCIERINDKGPMGVDYYTAKWLKEELKHGRRAVENGRLLTLGRQNWWLTKRESEKLELNYTPEYSRTNYADLFFTELGYAHQSLDISLSEGADIKHDMSIPVDKILHGKYDIVVDLGTAEHVADQKQYWTNVYDLLNYGGTLVGLSPIDGLCGHGLYQISPEFFQNLGGFSSKLWITTCGPLVKTVPYTGVRGKPYRWRTYCRYILTKTGPFAMPVQKSSMVTTQYKIPLGLAKFVLAIPGSNAIRRMFM